MDVVCETVNGTRYPFIFWFGWGAAEAHPVGFLISLSVSIPPHLIYLKFQSATKDDVLFFFLYPKKKYLYLCGSKTRKAVSFWLNSLSYLYKIGVVQQYSNVHSYGCFTERANELVYKFLLSFENDNVFSIISSMVKFF